jgi:hypothetical protein
LKGKVSPSKVVVARSTQRWSDLPLDRITQLHRAARRRLIRGVKSREIPPRAALRGVPVLVSAPAAALFYVVAVFALGGFRPSDLDHLRDTVKARFRRA